MINRSRIRQQAEIYQKTFCCKPLEVKRFFLARMTGRTCIVNLLIILFHRTDTFIGTNDIAEEDTWVNFDGTSISGNGFLYTMTNYPVSQPNGLTSQNCAIINPKPGNSIYTTNQTQDRSCTSSLSTDMLCYREGETCVICFLLKRVGCCNAFLCRQKKNNGQHLNICFLNF